MRRKSKKRAKLREINKVRTRFRAVFERYGKKTNSYTGREEQTILLKRIVRIDTAEGVTDHLWFNLTKGFQKLGTLTTGDIVEFDARVTTYKKGYWGRNEMRRMENPPHRDYKLERPTNIKLISDQK
jgi:hypothetical protein